MMVVFQRQCVILPHIQDPSCQRMCVFRRLRYGTTQCVALILFQTKLPLCITNVLPHFLSLEIMTLFLYARTFDLRPNMKSRCRLTVSQLRESLDISKPLGPYRNYGTTDYWSFYWTCGETYFNPSIFSFLMSFSFFPFTLNLSSSSRIRGHKSCKNEVMHIVHTHARF